MPALSDIKILELGFKMNATVLNLSAVLLNERLNLVLLFSSALEILASCGNSILASDRLD